MKRKVGKIKVFGTSLEINKTNFHEKLDKIKFQVDHINVLDDCFTRYFYGSSPYFKHLECGTMVPEYDLDQLIKEKVDYKGEIKEFTTYEETGTISQELWKIYEDPIGEWNDKVFVDDDAPSTGIKGLEPIIEKTFLIENHDQDYYLSKLGHVPDKIEIRGLESGIKEIELISQNDFESIVEEIEEEAEKMESEWFKEQERISDEELERNQRNFKYNDMRGYDEYKPID